MSKYVFVHGIVLCSILHMLLSVPMESCWHFGLSNCSDVFFSLAHMGCGASAVQGQRVASQGTGAVRAKPGGLCLYESVIGAGDGSEAC